MPHPLIAYPMSRDTFVCVAGGKKRDIRGFMTSPMPALLHALFARHGKLYLKTEWKFLEENNEMMGIIRRDSWLYRMGLDAWTEEYLGIDYHSFLMELFMNYIIENDYPVEALGISFRFRNHDVHIKEANWKDRTITIRYRSRKDVVLQIPEDMRGYVGNTDMEWGYLMKVVATMVLFNKSEVNDKILDMANKKAEERNEKKIFYHLQIEPIYIIREGEAVYEPRVVLYMCDENTLLPLYETKYNFLFRNLFLVSDDGKIFREVGKIYYDISSKKCFHLFLNEYHTSEITLIEIDWETRFDKSGVWIGLDGQHTPISFFTLKDNLGVQYLQAWGVVLHYKPQKIKGVREGWMKKNMAFLLLDRVARPDAYF